ncbi:prefoldin [Perkinsela sp. CCAP 1560/4]|nr:prefoldin [Perkinsela sp. CCAP 1560/4]|eukprot:KNH07497.1 prefoldin [Perkinsela sp. CCAP 1560/4]
MDSRVQLDSLSLEELQKVRNQILGDTQSIEQLYLTLKSGKDRLTHAKESLRSLVSQKVDAPDAYTQKDTLLPLTSSLYAYGRIPDIRKVTVDVGAKYFIQMAPERALKYYQGRIDALQQELQKVSQALQRKSKDAQLVDRVMAMKAGGNTQPSE